jgi:hypothetical protein
MKRQQIFISYSSHDEFEASLLQFALENLLIPKGVSAWSYQWDQKTSEKEVAKSLEKQIKQSLATVFIVSPVTLESGATQWMELAYSDAYNIETFVLLHHLTYQELKSKERGVPPLLLSSQCNPAVNWRKVADEIGKLI